MGNKYNVYIWVNHGREATNPYSKTYAWKEVYAGESIIKALVTFIKYFDVSKTGCVKLEGHP